MKNKDKTFWGKNWLTLVIVTILMIVAIAMCFLLATTQPTPTPRETALETLILTVFTFAASYLVSKIFAEMSYSQTLRDNGVQIASGIIVLKRQIEKLSEWTGKKRISFKKDGQVDASLEHVQCTLDMFRDMNNAALGGIAGVIGDALAQYENVMMQVSAIRGDALERTTEIEKKIQIADSSQVPALQNEIEEIQEKSEKRILELSRQTLLPIPSAPTKRKFSDKCPYCSGLNEFEMFDRPGETRSVLCRNCGGRFNAHVALGQRVFTRARPRPPWGNSQHGSPGVCTPVTVSSNSPSAPAVGTSAVSTPAVPLTLGVGVAPGTVTSTASPADAALGTEGSNSEPNELPSSIGTVTFRESLLASKVWIYSDRKTEVRRLLSETHSWVEPEYLKGVVAALLAADQRLRTSGKRRTANALQSVVFAIPNGDGIANTVFRRFVKLALMGRAFKSGTIKSSFFSAEYFNDLDENSLLAAYARGCIWRVANLRPLSVSDSPWLAELLFGASSGEFEEMVRGCLSERLKFAPETP
jgi:hypothetical protein